MQASMASGEGDASSIAMACVHAVACKPPGAWSHHAGGVQATTQAHEATMQGRASHHTGAWSHHGLRAEGCPIHCTAAPFIVPLPHSLYRSRSPNGPHGLFGLIH